MSGMMKLCIVSICLLDVTLGRLLEESLINDITSKNDKGVVTNCGI